MTTDWSNFQSGSGINLASCCCYKTLFDQGASGPGGGHDCFWARKVDR